MTHVTTSEFRRLAWWEPSCPNPAPEGFWDDMQQQFRDAVYGSPRAQPRACQPIFIDEHPDVSPLHVMGVVPVSTYHVGVEREEGMLGRFNDYDVGGQRERDVEVWLDRQVDLGTLVILRRSVVDRTWGGSAAWIVGQALQTPSKGPALLIGHVQEQVRAVFDRAQLPLERHHAGSPRRASRLRVWAWSHLAIYYRDKGDPAPVEIPIGWGEQEPWAILRAMVYG